VVVVVVSERSYTAAAAIIYATHMTRGDDGKYIKKYVE
jgi:hypothetical protein